MVGLLLPVVLVSVAAALWVGSIAGLRRLRIDWWPLALGSIGVHLLLHNPPLNQQEWALVYGPWLWVGGLVGMLAVLIRNALRHGPGQPAWWLGAIGIALNLMAVASNGGYMPQSPEARLAVRGATLPATANVTQLYNVTPITAETRFAVLGDVIAQPRWLPQANVVSIGDLLLSLAIAGLACQSIMAGATQVKRRNADS